MTDFNRASAMGMRSSVTVANDLRNADPTVYRRDVWGSRRSNDLSAVAPWADAVLWPRSRWQGGEMGMGILALDAAFTGRWAPPPPAPAGQEQLKIRGTTRDSAGAVLGSATVQGFITSTDVYVSQVVSDTAGYFEFCTQFSGQQHYLVAYKGGSPDIAGTTVNTLTPS